MVSGTSSPWFMRSLISGLRSSSEDMVSDRCRPLLSNMKGVFAPLPCIHVPQCMVFPQPEIPECLVCSQVNGPWSLLPRSTRMGSQMVSRGSERVMCSNSCMAKIAHRAGGAIQPHDLSRALHPLRAGTQC